MDLIENLDLLINAHKDKEGHMGETKQIITDCTQCYHSCGTKVTIKDGQAVKIGGLASHPLNKGRLCPKGANALKVVLIPHGWGGDANGNLLTDVNCREPIMGYPDLKSLQCMIRKA